MRVFRIVFIHFTFLGFKNENKSMFFSEKYFCVHFYQMKVQVCTNWSRVI